MTTANEVQNHLYTRGLLEGRAADVALRVKGAWHAVYRLHRVVLTQAGYFQSLFDGGFLESNFTRATLSASSGVPDQVILQFDDPNITRPAFEVCVSRLYGGGPALHVSPLLIPTPARPLTPAFAVPAPAPPATPSGHHNATPRFLLSLLATASFLEMHALAAQALDMILATVGPFTVLRYHHFATGGGIGEPEDDEPICATGLEVVAQAAEMEPPSECSSMSDDEGSDHGTRKSGGAAQTSTFISDRRSEASRRREAVYSYGRISDRIGEATVCFLSRWAVDILNFEEATANHLSNVQALPKPILVWARNGLTARWVRAVVSSDDFFITGEYDRYVFARRVASLRRREAIDPAEEQEFTTLFSDGIHYCHLLHEELVSISEDVCTVTRRPFVPITVLHSALWTQLMLRRHILARPSTSGSPSGSPSPAAGIASKEAGFCVTTADIVASRADDSAAGMEKIYYTVLADSSVRIGNPSNTTEPSEGTRHGPSKTTSEAHFFGLQFSRYTAATALAADTSGKARWSPYPPFRFGVEFWNVGTLEQKVFSHTVWYAGSLFNVYVQLVRKKGVQLGVYLHRQSCIESIPRPSTPPRMRLPSPPSGTRALVGASRIVHVPRPSTSSLPSPIVLRTNTPRPRSTSRPRTPLQRPPSRETMPVSEHGSPFNSPSRLQHSVSSHALSAPAQPFRDPRSAIVAYFGVSCTSATGSSLIRFSSAPDVFSIGQSWGWKSSALRSDDANHGLERNDESVREVSFRATVLIGLV